MGRAAKGTTAAERWRQRVARQRRSGLSVAEFCRREAVSPASFYAWRRRLEQDRTMTPPPLFVPVEMATGAGPVAGVQIELPGGAVVTLPADASPRLLTAAIRAAMGSHPRDEVRSC